MGAPATQMSHHAAPQLAGPWEVRVFFAVIAVDMPLSQAAAKEQPDSAASFRTMRRLEHCRAALSRSPRQ